MAKLILRLAKIFSLLIIFLVLILSAIWVLGPWLFQLETTENILFISPSINGSESKIYFAHFSPSLQNVQLVTLKTEELIGVIGGYGQYKLGSVYPLLKLEKRTDLFINSAFSWATQRVIDQVVVLDKSELKTRKNLLHNLGANLFYNSWLKPQQKLRLAKLYFFTRSLPTEQVQVSPQLSSLSQLEAIVMEPLQPECEVAVINTTMTPGLATKMTHILEESGVLVVRLADQSSAYQLSEFSLGVDNDQCQQLAAHLQVLFPTPVTIEDNDDLRSLHRADLVVLIGNDLAKFKP